MQPARTRNQGTLQPGNVVSRTLHLSVIIVKYLGSERHRWIIRECEAVWPEIEICVCYMCPAEVTKS